LCTKMLRDLGWVFVMPRARMCCAACHWAHAGSASTAAVLPETYTQLLMHCEAARRWELEGPSEAEARAIFQAPCS
jgi:hypothetical protein